MDNFCGRIILRFSQTVLFSGSLETLANKFRKRKGDKCHVRRGVNPRPISYERRLTKERRGILRECTFSFLSYLLKILDLLSSIYRQKTLAIFTARYRTLRLFLLVPGYSSCNSKLIKINY